MRICIPTDSDEGKDAQMNARFGSASFFKVFDTVTKKYETIVNSNEDHVHGLCLPTNVLKAQNIDMVIGTGMGMRAMQKLNEIGIKIFMASGGTVEKSIALFEKSELQKMDSEKACKNHEHGCE